MTDEERVTDLFGRLLASGVDLDDRELDMIVEVLAAVRLDERRAIATWLIEKGGMLGLANAIERGEHGS